MARNRAEGHPVRVLIIGTLPPPIGGASVLLKQLVDELRERGDVNLVVIETGGIRNGGLKGVFRFASVFWQTIWQVRRADVVALHAASGGLLIMGSILLPTTRFFRKPLLIRGFGGTYYPQSFGAARRAMTRTIVRNAHLFLVETKAMVRSAREEGIRRVAWYPNSRPLAGNVDSAPPESRPCRKFVYFGHVRPCKGIAEVIEAGERFGDEVSVDVYGPFLDGLSARTFEGLKTVRYCGVVPPDQAVATLRRYDILLLPTYHAGEGYPGVVLESFRAGRPVITTYWRAIPEIVDETCGILIDPHNADQLYDAMKRLTEDPQLYRTLCQGVRSQRQLFDSRLWTECFTAYCKVLAQYGGNPGHEHMDQIEQTCRSAASRAARDQEVTYA